MGRHYHSDCHQYNPPLQPPSPGETLALTLVGVYLCG